VCTENPVGFAKAAKIPRHGFDVVAVEAIDRECLAGNFQADTRKKLLDEIRRPREARRIVPEIALLERKGLRNLKKAAFNGPRIFGAWKGAGGCLGMRGL
jgi:hypothetical protein